MIKLKNHEKKTGVGENERRMDKKEFDPKNMSITIRIDCRQEEEMKMILEALQENFPKWKFNLVRKSVVLPLEDDPEQRKAHTSFTAKAWISKEEQIKE